MNSRQQFEAFLRAKNRGHIEEANRIIEHAIISSKTLPSIADGSKDETPLQGLLVKMQEEFMRIHRNHDAQNNYFNSMISNFKREIEQAQQALGDLKDTIKEEKKNVSQMASDQQRQFGAAQEGRLKEFSEYMKETNIMADIKMDLLNADIKKKITAVEADLHQMQKEVKQNFDAIIEQISHEAKNLSQDLKNKDIQANRLLESVGTERLPPERR